MAHARTHRRGGGGLFTALLLSGVVVLALLIGWVVWGGSGDALRERASNVDIQIPRAPQLPAMPNPDPLPTPTPSQPG